MPYTERYVRSDAAGGGDGTTNTNSGTTGAWTLAEAISGTSSVTANVRVNVRAGTYSLTTTTNNFNANGNTFRLWWRGFASTIGDLDLGPATPGASWSGPVFSYTSGFSNVNGTGQIFSNIRFVATSRNGAVVNCTPANLAAHNQFFRCIIENQNANSGAIAFRAEQANLHSYGAHGCYFKATTTATHVVVSRNNYAYSDSVIDGGTVGFSTQSAGGISVNIINCLFKNQTSHAINQDGVGSTSSFLIENNVIYEPGGDGVQIGGSGVTQNGSARIGNNTFVRCGGWGINSSSAASNTIIRAGNRFFNCASGRENGFGDLESFESGEIASEPYFDGDNWDFTVNSGAVASMGAFARILNGPVVNSSTRVAGLFQSSGGGGGGLILPRPMNGGYSA
jgi:hypothetical protein